MLNFLKHWIINICTAVFFITAIEIIIPNNSIKKYVKFVLGLILVTVMLNPIISLINKDYNVNNYVQKAQQTFSKREYKKDFERYKRKNKEDTLKNLRRNLEINTKKTLENKFPSNKYDVKIKITCDKNEEVKINEVNVGVEDSKIKKIKKISINKEVANTKKESYLGEGKIRNFISKELNVSLNDIKVYKI